MLLNRYFHKKSIYPTKKEDILLIPVALIHFLCGFQQKMDRKMIYAGAMSCDQRVFTTLK